MSSRNIGIFLIFAVGLLLLAVVLYFVLIGQDEPPPQTPIEGTPGEGTVLPDGAVDPGAAAVTAEPTPSNVIEVVVSLQTVPRGYQLTADILTTEVRDAASVGTNVVTNIDDVVGKYARNDIFQGQTLTFGSAVSDITLVGTEEYGPSSLIPPGFVAQAVPIDMQSSVAYAVSEGDYVDILLMFRLYQIDQEFQTLLPNAAYQTLETLGLNEGDASSPDGAVNDALETLDEDSTLSIFAINPLGRFEELPTGDLGHVFQSGPQRPVFIGMVIQNAKVVQVGEYVPRLPAAAALPTPTPEVTEGDATPTPEFVFPTSTPIPPDVILVAMQPQQQLLLRYAIETGSDIDLALRGVNDGQLYPVQNVDIGYLLETFNIEIPPNFGFTVDVLDVTPTPVATGEAGFAPTGEN